MPQDIAKLVRRAQGGDGRAFGLVIERYYRTVHAIHFTQTTDWQAAEDLTQEAFLTAWTHLEQLREPAAFASWLRQIARNLTKNYFRSEDYGRKLRAHYGKFREDQGVQAATPEDAMNTSEQERDVWSAVETLQPNLREVVIAFYWHGQSIRETAAALDITPSAAKKRLQYAREKLRGQLESRFDAVLIDKARALDGKSASARMLPLLAAGPAMPDAASSALPRAGDLAVAPGKTAAGGVTKALALGGAVLAIVGVGAYVLLTGGVGSSAPEQSPDAIEETPVSRIQPEENSSLGIGAPPEGDDAAAIEQSPSAETEPDGAVIEGDTTLRDEETPDVQVAEAPEEESGFADIRGWVFNERGEPIEDVEVIMLPTGSWDTVDAYSRQAMRRTFSDNDGIFTIDSIPAPNTVSIFARADGLRQDGNAWLELIADKVNEVTIRMVEGTDIYGRLLTPRQKPVTDATVILNAYAGDGYGRGGVQNGAYTDESGRFHIVARGEGVVALETRSERHGAAIFTNVPTGTGEEIELIMDEHSVIEGTVFDADGEPVEGGMTVHAFDSVRITTGNSSVGFGGSFSNEAEVGEDGRYRLAGLSPVATYRLEVRWQGGPAVSVRYDVPPLEAGRTTRFDITLEGRHDVTGVVLGAETGKPLRDIRVGWYKDTPGNGSSREPDENGRFSATLLSGAGTYTFYPSYEFGHIDEATHGQRVEIPVEPDEPIELRFPDTVTRSVRVTDVYGEPLRAKVNLREERSERGDGSETDGDGYFAFHGFRSNMPAGFAITADGYVRYQLPLMTGRPGEELPTAHVVLHEAASVYATPVTPEGATLPGARANVYAVADGQRYWVAGEIGADGTLWMEESIPAGRVDLRLFVVSNDAYWQSRIPDVTLIAHETNDFREIVVTETTAENYDQIVRQFY